MGKIRHSADGWAAGEAPPARTAGGLDSITSVFHNSNLTAGVIIIAPWVGRSFEFVAACGFLIPLAHGYSKRGTRQPSASRLPLEQSQGIILLFFFFLWARARPFPHYGLFFGPVARAVRAGPRALGPWGWGHRSSSSSWDNRDPASVDVGSSVGSVGAYIRYCGTVKQSPRPSLIGLKQPRQSGAPHHTLTLRLPITATIGNGPMAEGRPCMFGGEAGEWWLADVG